MLRNINDLLGFRIAAKDGDIGTVKDFYFDDETWTIRYLIVKTGPWFSREVLIAPEAVTDHSWEADAVDKSKYALSAYDQAEYRKHVIRFNQPADIL